VICNRCDRSVSCPHAQPSNARDRACSAGFALATPSFCLSWVRKNSKSCLNSAQHRPRVKAPTRNGSRSSEAIISTKTRWRLKTSPFVLSCHRAQQGIMPCMARYNVSTKETHPTANMRAVRSTKRLRLPFSVPDGSDAETHIEPVTIFGACALLSAFREGRFVFSIGLIVNPGVTRG